MYSFVLLFFVLFSTATNTYNKYIPRPNNIRIWVMSNKIS